MGSSAKDFKIDFFISAVSYSVSQLLKYDRTLIEVRSSERSICHKLAHYLTTRLGKHGLDVDCEYNRDGSYPKMLATTGTTVFPDIIVHKRNSTNNFLIVEVKFENEDQNYDREKLKAYIMEYEYKYGLLLTVPQAADKPFQYEWWKRASDGNAEIHVASQELKIVANHVDSLSSFLQKLGLNQITTYDNPKIKNYLKRLRK